MQTPQSPNKTDKDRNSGGGGGGGLGVESKDETSRLV